MQLTEFLASKQFTFTPSFDGQMQRFDRGSALSGWAIGFTYKVGQKLIQTLKFGDWRTGESYDWQSSDSADNLLTPEEFAELQTQIEQTRQAREKLRTEQNEAAAQDAKVIWENAIDRGITTYLAKKGLSHLFGAKIDSDNTSILLVPARDIHGKLWGLQRIYASGRKEFQKNMRIKGCFHLFGSIKSPEGPIYVAEGFATAASIHLATGAAVASCFNAGNISNVCHEIRQTCPKARIIICGDNDRWTRLPDGTPVNPGYEKAMAAAKEINGHAYFPIFRSLDGRPTDFNDLHAREGIEIVKDQMQRQFPVSSEIYTGKFEHEDGSYGQPTGARGEPEVTINVIDTGGGDSDLPGPSQKKKSGAEMRVVNQLLKGYGSKLLKQDKDLFHYDGKRWVWMTPNDVDQIKQQIMSLYNYTAKSKDIESAFKTFLVFCPKAPKEVNLFTPPPMACNFENGTLHVVRKNSGSYSLDFRPHNPADFMINTLPFEYKDQRDAKNQAFLDMLDRVFEGEPDKTDKIRAVRQMYGACLLPAFPHLFMLYGPPGTGKSTVMMIASRLVHADNLCDVEPHDFHGFNMESMAGKLVNMDTDITTTEPIHDSIVKKIIDRRTFRIRRKGIKDIYAPLPSTHIFGGNEIPRTLEGASRAHDRRWTFIGFEKFQAKGQYDKEFHDWVFQQNPQGILNFALQGLDDLLANKGHFHVPESGRRKMEEWQRRTDIVGQFVHDVIEGLVVDKNTKVFVGENAKIERKRLWTNFCEWHKEVLNFPPRIGRTAFFDMMRKKNFQEKTIKGVDYFVGLGVSEVESSMQ